MFAKVKSTTHRDFIITAGFLLSLLAMSLISSIAIGQDPGDLKVDPINPDYIVPEVPEDVDRAEKTRIRGLGSAAKKKKSRDNKAAIASLESTVSPTEVDPYISGFILPSMTQTDDATLSQLGTMRKDFLDDFMSEDVSPTNRRYLVNTHLIPFANKTIAENYHPAVRLNAILLLGMVNEVDPARNQQMPRPSMDCINYLIQIANSDSAPEFIKVGAITGLHRNTLFDSKQPTPRIDGGARNQIATLALAIAKNTATGQDKWSPETSYWLRRRSVQILGYLGEAGNNSERTNAVLEILANQDEKTWLRFDAMVALGEMDLTSTTADETLQKVTTYVSESLRNEANQLNSDLTELVAINLLYGSEDLLKTGTKKKKEKFQRGEGMSADESSQGSGSDEEEAEKGPKIDLPIYRTNDARRRVQGLTYNAVKVLEAVDAKVSQDKKEIIKDAIERLNDVLTDADVGLVNLADEDKKMDDLNEEEAPKAIADQMSEIFSSAATQLEKIVSNDQADEGSVLDQ